MNDHIFEVLSKSSTDELIKIASNKNNEFNEDTVNSAKQILEERNVDVTQIPVDNSVAAQRKSGDEEIRSLKFKAGVHIVLGPVLFLGGGVMFGLSFYFGFSLIYLFFVILGARSIYLYFKLSKTAKTLAANRDNSSSITMTDDEVSLVKGLHQAILSANNGDLGKLEVFLTANITKQNFDRITLLYQTEYYKDFVEDIKDVSSQFSIIEKALKPLTDLGLVEPKYPHSRIQSFVSDIDSVGT